MTNITLNFPKTSKFIAMVSQPSYRQAVLTRLQNHHNTLQSFGIRSLALFGSVARDEATPT